GLVRLLGAEAQGVWPVAVALAGALGLHAVWPWPHVQRLTLRLASLPAGLDGYRIAQISDVHCGPFAPERRVRLWAARVNRLGPALVAVTGDLTPRGTSHIEAVARALGTLQAPQGRYVCMGNHDYFGAGEPLVQALEAQGLVVLRNQRRQLGELSVAGVDDT